MNHEQIDAIAAVLRQSRTLTEVEVRNGSGVSLRLRRPAPKAALSSPSRVPVPRAATADAVALSAAAAAEDEKASIGSVPLTAEVVGVFRSLKSDDAVTIGAEVKEGQLLGHIEAMRLLNDCLAPGAGTILRVLVEEGQPVEYGQFLFEVALTS